MKTRLCLCLINSAAFRNRRKPQGCCVTHSFSFGFTTHCLQKAMEASYRNKATKLVCLLVKDLMYSFFSANLSEIQPLFLFRKVSGNLCLRESNIHKIQTSTGLDKSISVCQMTKQSFRLF